MGEEVLHHAEGICPACGCLVDTDNNGIWLDVVMAALLGSWGNFNLILKGARFALWVLCLSQQGLFLLGGWTVILGWPRSDGYDVRFLRCYMVWYRYNHRYDRRNISYRYDPTRIWYAVVVWGHGYVCFLRCYMICCWYNHWYDRRNVLYRYDPTWIWYAVVVWSHGYDIHCLLCYMIWYSYNHQNDCQNVSYGYDRTRIWSAVVVWEHSYFFIWRSQSSLETIGFSPFSFFFPLAFISYRWLIWFNSHGCWLLVAGGLLFGGVFVCQSHPLCYNAVWCLKTKFAVYALCLHFYLLTSRDGE
jgi:hypothetical protein